MTRLPEEPSNDPTDEAANLLLRGVPPTAANPEMKRRVWAALTSPEPRAVFGFRVLRLPVVMAAAVVLFAAGTAGAVIARRFIAPAFHRAAVTTPEKALVAPVARKAPARAAKSAQTVVAVADPAPAELDSPAPAPRPPVNRGTRRVSAPVSERLAGRPAPEGAGATASPRERAEVLDAMIALRRDHDADHAGQLLDRYLAARPHGALREEALALAIEAADARGDRASVSHWARTYQADYPSGRFAGFARSHLNTP